MHVRVALLSFFAIAASILFAGCDDDAAPMATQVPPTPQPTATRPAPPPATATPTVTLVAPSATGTVRPPLPTSSPVPAPTSTPTPTATATATAPPATTGEPLRNVTLERAFPRLPGGAIGQRPLFLTYPPDGTNRVVVVDQNGRVVIFPNDPNASSVGTFLDLTGRVGREGTEEGLLGLAFHPRYAENGFVYVYYTAYNPRRSVISRFRVSSDANRLDQASEMVILEIGQPFANHNGGMIVFGPDGFMYIGLGDGGGPNDPSRNGQNLGVLLGKLLRIDVDRQEPGRAYAIPTDNPFVSQAGARGEIWAYGLRNPWRFSFDRATGAIWAGDVGQSRLEEVDIIRKGLNYGWNVMEGNSCLSGTTCNRAGLEPPIAEYGRDKGCSVTGGYVYRGPSLPWLRGAYLYSDFCSGRIWAIRHDGARVTEERELAGTGRSVSSFGEDAAGEVYLLAFDGNVYRMRAAS